MENVTEALIISFSAMFFVIALSISMIFISNVQVTADAVIQRLDQTVVLEDQTEIDDVTDYRIVGMETITPVLYRYYKDETTISFLSGAKIEDSKVKLPSLSKLDVYQTNKTNENNWGKSYYDASDPANIYYSYGCKLDWPKGGTSKGISVISLSDEIARNEPWVGNTTLIKEHVDDILSLRSGETTLNKPLADKSQKYVELIYDVKNNTEIDPTDDTLITKGKKTTDSAIITYIQIGS